MNPKISIVTIAYLFTYIKDGRYPIDNNAAERAARPLTTQRNNMLHFGSRERRWQPLITV